MITGAPIVVVSGLPRAGTSMAMRMLESGGMPLMTDGVRTPDSQNPRGYFEYERVKELDKDLDKSWLEAARGRAIKIISFLLRHLPESNDYRVILMHRRMREVMASQDSMLRARGEKVAPGSVDIAAAYEQHMRDVGAWLRRHPRFSVLDLDYNETIAQPHEQAERIASFVERSLDVAKMAAAVEPGLQRNRT